LGLNDADGVVRARCADAIRATAEVLADLLKRTSDDGKPGEPPPARGFSQADIDGIKDVLKAFQAAGPRLAGSLQDADVGVRLAVVQTLERLSDTRFRLAEEPLSIGSYGKITGRVSLVPPQASDPLSQFAKDDWRAVAHLLSDPDVRVRRGAVYFLQFFGDARPGVVPDLIRALADADRLVRLGAARALGVFSKTYRPQDGVPAVSALAKLLFDNDFEVRQAAASTLEGLGPHAESAVAELARAIHFGDVENRVDALWVLQNVGPERSKAAIASVTDAMEQLDPRVRRAAAETLGKYGALARNTKTIDALRRALGDEDQEVRINVSEALLQILGAGKAGK
jgi:HEAT repeat protein